MKSSPCQHLMSRRTRTLVPVSSNLLYPEVIDGVSDSLELKRQKGKSYFDKNAKPLPELNIGEEARVSDKKRKTWQPGKCLEQLSDRSYLVQSDCEVMHRNREDIKPMPDTSATNSTPTISEEPRARESLPNNTKTPAMPT